MIDIKDISGKILLSVPITESCEHVEELMQSDHIVLSWNSDKSDILPMGAYIEYGGEKYSLLEPYSPIQKSEGEFSYQPLFKSVVISWTKVPFFMYTYSSDDAITGREPDWTLTDNPANFMLSICKAIKNETGETWTYTVDASLSASATLSFQSVDIFSSLNSIANAFETEWWVDKVNKVIHLSKAEHGIAVRLEVGKNITVPTVTAGKEGYYTRFYAFGSTRNIVQDYEGANVNNLVNKRLTLDPAKYPNGYKDVRPDLKQGEIFPKILIFDNVYPSSSLEISDVRVRLMWTIGEDGEKVQVGTDDDGNPIYDQYSIWYFKVPGFVLNNTIYSKDNPEGMLISGKALSVHFESGALQGREFELIYHDKAETVSSADGTSVILTPGDYEIKFKEEGTYIIPAITSLIPNNGDEIILFNIRMPEEYVGSAYLELESEMNKDIARLSSDLNNYQFSSNPISFSENNPDLSIGRKITYVNGEYSFSTRVIKLVTKIDFKYIQSITVGNEKIKGNTQELKEEVISANKDINLLSVLNDMTTSLTQSYNRTQQMMLEGFAAIKNIWQLKEDSNGNKYAFSAYQVVTERSITMYAQGPHSDLPSIYEGLPIDGVTIQWVDGKLVATGGKGTANGIVVNGNTYTPNEDGIITLPNYPTTLPASDVYSWAKQPNKPSYSFSELSSHPTTLGGYGITDAYTKSDADGKYVLKAGDTVTGTLLFNANSGIDLAYIPRTKPAISFNNAGSNRIGINFTDGDDNLRIAKTDINQDWVSGDVNILLGSNNYKVLHTGNYAGELDNRYVNKIGDAMTGNLVFAHTSERPSYSGSIGITFREQIANGQGVKLVYNDYDDYRAPAGLILVGEQGGEYFEAPAIYQNGYKVWDAGNKRDMFSSMNEAFTTWGNEQVISVEGDANTYYPVVITINHSKTWNSRISIYKNLGSRTPSYPGNHDNGTSSMWAMYEGRYNGWDGNGGYIVTKYVRQPYANLISKAEHAGNSAGKLVVYLRGGGCEYRVCTDYRAGVSVYYERTEISGYINYPVYVEPTTSVGNQGVLNLVSYDYLVQKAVRLETPRSLWGQTFDGTGNVNGTIHVNSGGIYPIILRNSGGSECSIDYQCSGEHFVAGVYPDRFFIWGENGGEIASFLSNGNVGIGSISTSGNKLYVNGDVGVAGTIYFEILSGGSERNLLYQQMADNDLFRIRCGGPSNQGWVEIATADDGTEPIYVRQYTGAFSSIARTLTLLDGSGNTICPGNLLTYGGITMYSDLRKKNVLNSIIVPLDVMANADLFDYTFKTDEKCKVRAGTSAQYWNRFLPQVTDTDNEGFFTMSYDVLATTCVLSMAKHFQRFLMEDFNNHETRIEFLERENKELKDSNKEMMNRIIELERRAA